MKILVIALSGIGDALMFTPSLIKLKEKYPEAEIDALAMFKGVEDIYSKLPQISKIHFWDFLNKGKFESLKFVLGLRKKYDVVINVYPANRKEYNLISLLIGADKRASVEYLRMDYQNLGFLNNVRVKEDDSLHNTQENIRLVEKITGEKITDIPPYQLFLDESVLNYADEYLTEKNISADDLVIGFHPGCAMLKNHDKRRWESEKFSGLALKLINDFNAKILLFGGPDEDGLKDSIKENVNSDGIENVKTQSLTQTAAVMKRCNLFVTNDSSLMHVASALQLNIVAIIGPTNINYIHPWKTNYSIVSLNLECAPCFHYSPKPLMCSRTDKQFKCIKDLDVDMVYKSAAEQINKMHAN